MVEGFLAIDKASGWTSHDVVAKARRVIGVRRVGHAGTLDPMATGLVVLGMGRATRLIRYVQDQAKEYVADIVFGVATDTLDVDGAILSREPMPCTEEELRKVLPRFVGRILQVPPMVSALHHEGRRLYELAREGVEVERPARPVDVYGLDLEEFAPGEYPEARVRVRCGKGTYVRSLADDIARALGGRAHLAGLRRTGLGALRVDRDAVTIEELEKAAADHVVEQIVIRPAEMLSEMTRLEVDVPTAAAVSNGVRFAAAMLRWRAADGDRAALVDESGRLLAVYRCDGRQAVPEVVLA